MHLKIYDLNKKQKRDVVGQKYNYNSRKRDILSKLEKYKLGRK